MTYQPTHVHRVDGSPAMMTHSQGKGRLCIMENENGDRWPDRVDEWQPIRIKPDPFDGPPPGYTKADRDYVKYGIRYAVRVLGHGEVLAYLDELEEYRHGDI